MTTGDRIRITTPKGQVKAGLVTAIKDTYGLGDGRSYDYAIVLTHRPQWPSMAATTQVLHCEDDDAWYDDKGQPLTIETIAPAAEQPSSKPALQLVKRQA